MDRRTFLSRVTIAFSATTGFLLSLPVFRFISGSVAESSTDRWYPITDITSLTEDVTQVHFTRLIRDGWQQKTVEDYVWISRLEDGTFAAFEPHCTHLGCAYSWTAEIRKFTCPCHGGKFDHIGNKTDGPPKRPLDRYEVQLAGNLLKIGKLIRA
jgi:menaquinol-cytochrome c reductase iron-sulfur subunit